MSMNEKVDIEIAHRRLTIEVEGLMPMEISSIARKVNEKYEEVQSLYPKVVDSSKLAMYTALYLAIDLYQLEQHESTNRMALENTLDNIGKVLQKSLAATGSAAEPE
jgi:cell division protein ZapA (FtsZ GTPase activity inhibitor)